MTTDSLDTTKHASASDIISEAIKGLPEELQDNFKVILQDDATSVHGLIDGNQEVVSTWKALMVSIKNNSQLSPLGIVMIKYFPSLVLTEEEEISILNDAFVEIPLISRGETLFEFMSEFQYTPEQKTDFIGKFIPLLFANLDEKVELVKMYVQAVAVRNIDPNDPRIIPGSIKLLGRALDIDNLDAKQRQFIEQGVSMYMTQIKS